ncbi:unnamed protein product [Amoebophrya sp. A25]|nr:unnamed protein product [Amoebophrya sp. A25]|eukprot:GSA25T00007481001.1
MGEQWQQGPVPTNAGLTLLLQQLQQQQSNGGMPGPMGAPLMNQQIMNIQPQLHQHVMALNGAGGMPGMPPQQQLGQPNDLQRQQMLRDSPLLIPLGGNPNLFNGAVPPPPPPVPLPPGNNNGLGFLPGNVLSGSSASASSRSLPEENEQRFNNNNGGLQDPAARFLAGQLAGLQPGQLGGAANNLLGIPPQLAGVPMGNQFGGNPIGGPVGGANHFSDRALSIAAQNPIPAGELDALQSLTSAAQAQRASTGESPPPPPPLDVASVGGNDPIPLASPTPINTFGNNTEQLRLLTQMAGGVPPPVSAPDTRVTTPALDTSTITTPHSQHQPNGAFTNSKMSTADMATLVLSATGMQRQQPITPSVSAAGGAGGPDGSSHRGGARGEHSTHKVPNFRSKGGFTAARNDHPSATKGRSHKMTLDTKKDINDDLRASYEKMFRKYPTTPSAQGGGGGNVGNERAPISNNKRIHVLEREIAQIAREKDAELFAFKEKAQASEEKLQAIVKDLEAKLQAFQSTGKFSDAENGSTSQTSTTFPSSSSSGSWCVSASQAESAEAELASERKRADDLQAAVAKLEAKLAESTSQIERLASTPQDPASSSDSLVAEMQNLRKEREQLEARASKVASELEKANEHAEMAQLQVDTAKSDAAEAKAETEAAKAEAERIKAEVEVLKAEAIKTSAEARNAAVSAAEAAKDAAVAEAVAEARKEASAAREAASAEKRAIEAQRDAAIKQKADAEAAKEAAIQEKAAAEAAKQAALEEKASAEANLSTERQALLAERKALEEEKRQIEANDNDELYTQKTKMELDFEKRTKNMQTEAKRLETVNKSLQKQIDRFKSQEDVLKKKVSKEVQREKETAERKMTAKEKEVSALKDKINNLEAELQASSFKHQGMGLYPVVPYGAPALTFATSSRAGFTTFGGGQQVDRGIQGSQQQAAIEHSRMTQDQDVKRVREDARLHDEVERNRAEAERRAKQLSMERNEHAQRERELKSEAADAKESLRQKESENDDLYSKTAKLEAELREARSENEFYRKQVVPTTDATKEEFRAELERAKCSLQSRDAQILELNKKVSQLRWEAECNKAEKKEEAAVAVA